MPFKAATQSAHAHCLSSAAEVLSQGQPARMGASVSRHPDHALQSETSSVGKIAHFTICMCMYRFQSEVDVGMVGVNVPIPVPLP